MNHYRRELIFIKIMNLKHFEFNKFLQFVGINNYDCSQQTCWQHNSQKYPIMHIFKNRKWNLKFTIRTHPHKVIEVHVKKCIKSNQLLKDLTMKPYKINDNKPKFWTKIKKESKHNKYKKIWIQKNKTKQSKDKNQQNKKWERTINFNKMMVLFIKISTRLKQDLWYIFINPSTV